MGSSPKPSSVSSAFCTPCVAQKLTVSASASGGTAAAVASIW